MHPVDAKKLVGRPEAESSSAVAERVKRAREVQQERFRAEDIFTNAEMSSRQMKRYCPLSKPCRDMMEKMIDKMGFSARAFTRVIKLARTIADLDGTRDISIQHLMEASSYRFLDKRNIQDL